MSMRRIAVGFVALLWLNAAVAANHLRFGPTGAWVSPQRVPAAGPAGQAAVKFLLADRQVELTADTVRYYVENAVRIQTPQGLSALGTIALTWNPDTDVMIVHKVDLVRGGKVMNLLANGRRFTIAKRETNLEAATLDDTLTAILQPPGLRVGDIVEVAYTLVRREPLLDGTPAAEIQIPPTLPVVLLHMRALWRASLPIRWQAGRGLAGVHRIRDGAQVGVSVNMHNAQPVIEPRFAPLRFQVERRIDLSAFRSWAQLARRFAPLYSKAAQLGAHSPLRAEVARIRAATAAPRRQAALALRLVENQVRYLFLDLNDGGLRPAPADLTWSRRFGDCKGKTVLLLALLHALGIQAEPVAVNVTAGDIVAGRLPMIQLFDHVLVRAVIAGRTYWLDGTRLGDRSLRQLHIPYYHWGLPLIARGARLLRMVPPPPKHPLFDTRITIDAAAGILRPAPFHVETSMRGAVGVFFEQRLANLTPDQLDESLRRYWAQRYDFVQVKTVSARYDRKAHAERLTMDGTARLQWRDHDYLTDGLGVGYVADFSRSSGPNRAAPYAVAYPYYTRSSEVIRLPQHGRGFTVVGADIDRTVAGMRFRRRARIRGGVFRAVATQRSVAREFPAHEAARDQRILRRLSDSNLYVRAPAALITRRAAAKRAAAAQDYRDALAMMKQGQLRRAIAEVNRVIKLQGPRGTLLALRALAYIWEGNAALAARDAAAARARNPRTVQVHLVSGVLAFDTGRMRTAIRSLTAALTIEPKLVMALEFRCQAYLRRGELKHAAADAGLMIRAVPPGPGLVQLYWMRAAILARAAQRGAARHQAELLVRALPDSPAAFFVAGRIDSAFGAPARARELMSRGVHLHSASGSAYTMRMKYRPWSDLVGRRADLRKALKAHPGDSAALMALASLDSSSGHYHRALRTLDALLRQRVAVASWRREIHRSLLDMRGIVYSKLGQSVLARRDFAAARAAAHSALALAGLCWLQASNGVALHQALAECSAALERRPYALQVLTADGLELMRLGHYRAAIRAYDRVLSRAPIMGGALYGRGICERRLGERRRGDLDIRIAKIDSPRAADQMAHDGSRA